MKKTKYINKYDFINYFSKPKYLWFLSNTETKSILEAAVKIYYKSNDNEINCNDIEENESDFEENEIENDSYELYSEAKENNEDMDEKNPQIYEGRIIDKKSKDYIKEKFKNINKIIDFEDIEYKSFKQEEIAKITKEYLTKYENVILFQPVFIDKNNITKPDAFIKEKENIKLIETKGTSSTRIVHYLDVLFQKEVIENQDFLKDFYFEYFLCVIDYCKLNKNEISFVITECFNYSKNFNYRRFNPEKESIEEYIENKKNKKLGIDINNDSFANYSLKFKNALNTDLNIIIEKKDDSKSWKTKESIDKAICNISYINNNFLSICKEILETLFEYQNKWKNEGEESYIKWCIKQIWPSTNDSNDFKMNDIFPHLKSIYKKMGFLSFGYSGNVTIQDKRGIENLLELKKKFDKNKIIKPLFKKPKNSPNFWEELFVNTKEDLVVNYPNTKKFLDSIKDIKVYFDFETINTAIRSVDKSYPFTQVVTQCSILKIKNNKELGNCNNLICDPKKIDIEWYKKIVDSLYTGDKEIYETSFIVYNKSFESSRLKEISEYLDKTYKNKINQILNNIVDLADLFSISSKKGYLIFLKNLYGFYSIKKVLPIIEQNDKDSFNSAKCLNYKTLDVQNGKICQEETTLRFFNVLTDNEWNDLSIKLQKYCENDVRAMLAVELFARKILKKLE